METNECLGLKRREKKEQGEKGRKREREKQKEDRNCARLEEVAGNGTTALPRYVAQLNEGGKEGPRPARAHSESRD